MTDLQHAICFTVATVFALIEAWCLRPVTTRRPAPVFWLSLAVAVFIFVFAYDAWRLAT